MLQPSCLFTATESVVLSLFLMQMRAAVHLPSVVQWKHLASLKLCCTIQINKQVSKRGQITVKPTKDSCSWNNPWRLDFPGSSFSTQIKGQCQGRPAWCVGSCGEPPRSSYSYYYNCAWNVGGSATSNISGHLQWKIVLILFCSVPLLNPHTWRTVLQMSLGD